MPSLLVGECLCLDTLSHGPTDRLCERSVATDHYGERTTVPSDLPPRFWIKANNFQGLVEFLLNGVATIKFIYM
jgi:hypothetical protein